MRKFRCAAESAAAGIERCAEQLRGGVAAAHRVSCVSPARRWRIQVANADISASFCCAQLRFVLAVVLATRAAACRGNAGRPKRGFSREIGAAEEGPLIVVCQEHGERPAAGALRQHLLRDLVDAVDVGPLFAIDLDVDEQVVHDLRPSPSILEDLVRHDVAPVAGGVADAQQDGLAFRARALERLGSPRIPVDGVVRVLAQVRARFVRQAVGGIGGVQSGSMSHSGSFRVECGLTIAAVSRPSISLPPALRRVARDTSAMLIRCLHAAPEARRGSAYPRPGICGFSAMRSTPRATPLTAFALARCAQMQSAPRSVSRLRLRQSARVDLRADHGPRPRPASGSRAASSSGSRWRSRCVSA